VTEPGNADAQVAKLHLDALEPGTSASIIRTHSTTSRDIGPAWSKLGAKRKAAVERTSPKLA